MHGRGVSKDKTSEVGVRKAGLTTLTEGSALTLGAVGSANFTVGPGGSPLTAGTRTETFWYSSAYL